MFKRLSNLIRGFLSLFISGIERTNPEALLEVEKENLRVQIARYNQGLTTHAALVERLKTRVKKLSEQEKDARAKTLAHLKAGNKERAAEFALDLQKVTAQLEQSRIDLEQNEATLRDLEKARDITIETAKDKIEKLKYSIGDMKVQRATAEMMEMASGMISEIGGSGDNLNRLEEMVDEEREQAAGKARVARGGLKTEEFDLKETEQAALADQALADFAAKEGIALEPSMAADAIPAGSIPADTAKTSDTAKAMGPVSESSL